MLMALLALILILPLEVSLDPKCRYSWAAEVLLVYNPLLHSFTLHLSICSPETNTPAKKLDSKRIAS